MRVHAGGSAQFGGTERFRILRQLGAGGMGVVYEADDRTRGMRVALKTLLHVDATAIYHFKNEFRALAGLHHPNLIALYELIHDAGHWFFTMELVDGVDLLDYVASAPGDTAPVTAKTRVAGPAAPANGGTVAGWAPTDAPASTAPATPALMVPAGPYDEQRLRDALGQLAIGLYALHESGRVHRDIKPSNTLITRDGRVVLMDFGLAADAQLIAEVAATRQIAGTPIYMAPEQGEPGAPIGPPADWFAVGVILYQVLTGQYPYNATTFESLVAAKLTETPQPPAALVPGCAGDLNALCRDLLEREPNRRPDGREILARLGVSRTGSGRGPVARPNGGAIFVGRHAELAVLRAGAVTSRRAATSMFVQGASGLGKTALIQTFLAEQRSAGNTVLEGRCYEEESVPYKAFDGMIDALSRRLVTMPHDEAAALLPPDAALAGRLFPVLLRVPHLAGRLPPLDPTASPQALRSLAVGALVEVFRRLADAGPLVLFVDDLQWADEDSLLLLRELMHPSTAPPILLVASVRTGTTGDGDPDSVPEAIAELRARRIHLQPLTDDDAAALVDSLLPSGAATSAQRATIAKEAAGHPLFLAELAFFRAESGVDALAAGLDDALWERVRRLDDDQRRVMEVCAIAGIPVAHATLAEAAGLDAGTAIKLAAALRSAHLVKVSRATGDEAIEPYHDRVRESVLANLGADAFADGSRRLADAMLHAGLGETAPEIIVRHLLAAGDSARGAELAQRAAERAMAALAFDRAAEFYRTALRAGARDAVHARELHIALGDALANGGRGREAADAFLAAGADLDDSTRLDCQRRAAEQLLASGHVDQGLEQLRDVLAAMGDAIPPTPDRALRSLEFHRAELDDAGLVLAEAGAAIEPRILRRIDVYQATSLGLMLVDNVRGADFQVQAVLTALRAGEPYRALRALVFEAIYRCQEGEAGRRRAAELMDAARPIAHGRSDARMDAYLVLGDAFMAYYLGQFKRAVEVFTDADVRFRALAGVAWEQTTIRIHRLRATDYQGAWGELRRLYDEYLRDAQRRNDKYMAASITRWFNVLWLANDQPDKAAGDLDRSPWRPPREGAYHLQHFLELRARVELSLYRGDAAKQANWALPGLDMAERAQLFRIQIAMAIADWLRGRLHACTGNIDAIDDMVRRLDDQRIGYASIWGGMLRGASLAQRGDAAAAVGALEQTAAIADHNDFPLCATICRLRAGQLIVGPAGGDRVAAAVAWMRSQDIRNPLHMANVFAPGFA